MTKPILGTERGIKAENASPVLGNENKKNDVTRIPH